MNTKKLFIVIHVDGDMDRVNQNIDLTQSFDVEGIFLISHETLMSRELIKFGLEVKKKYPNLWIGYNFLNIPSSRIFNVLRRSIPSADGIWIDNSWHGISIYQSIKMNDKLMEARMDCGAEYFGGIAFKHQQQPGNLVRTLERITTENIDVVVTSGDGTSLAADIDKIKTMRSALKPEIPLAIASGITPENINSYLPFADQFLVSTGISDPKDCLISERLEILLQQIKNYREKI